MQRGGGGWLKERYEAAVRGAIHCVSKEIYDQQAKRTYCSSEYSKDTNPYKKTPQSKTNGAKHVVLVQT